MNCKESLHHENQFGMNYKVFYPDAEEDLPLIVYLHGAGERGTRISHLDRHGLPKLIREGREVPAVVLAPQCPEWCVWDNIADKVKQMIDCVVREFHIEKDRISMTAPAWAASEHG